MLDGLLPLCFTAVILFVRCTVSPKCQAEVSTALRCAVPASKALQ